MENRNKIILCDYPKLDNSYEFLPFEIEENRFSNGALRECKLLYIIDGDTFNVKLEGKVYRIRLIVVDTPETIKKIDKWGITAKEFTTNILKQSEKILIQIDNKSNKTFDEYGRLLAWVWVKINGEYYLLQSLLVANGLATIKYIDHPEVMYLDSLYIQEEIARTNKLKVWGDSNDPNWISV